MRRKPSTRTTILLTALTVPVALLVGAVHAGGHVATLLQSVAITCVRSWDVLFAFLAQPGHLWSTLLSLGVGFGVARGLAFLVRHVRGERRLRQSLARRRVRRGAATSRYRDVVVVDDRRPYALTLGAFRPTIYLSTAAAGQLAQDELEAVVVHERHHRRSDHPLCTLLANALQSFLWFLPSMERLTKHLVLQQEIAADRAAARATSRLAVAKALVKMLGPNRRLPTVSAPAFATLDRRIEHLLDRPRGAAPRIPQGALLLSLAAVTILTVSLFRSPTVARAHVAEEIARVAPHSSSSACHGQNATPLTRPASPNRTPLR